MRALRDAEKPATVFGMMTTNFDRDNTGSGRILMQAGGSEGSDDGTR
jgi:hypothetical protein